MNTIDGDNACYICYSALNESIYINLNDCGHSFCLDCTTSWISKMARCPLDKKEVKFVSCHHSDGTKKYSTDVTTFVKDITDEMHETLQKYLINEYSVIFPFLAQIHEHFIIL